MLYTTADELLARFRDDVVDPLEGVDASHPDSENLWSNKTLYEYMTQAFDAWARETHALVKTVVLDVVAGEPTVALPQTVLKIKENGARLTTRNRLLHQFNINQYGYEVSDYGITLHDTSALYNTARGWPNGFVRDSERNALRLFPVPSHDDVLELRCSVVPALPMTDGVVLPARQLPDIMLVLQYMKYLAYARQDSDTQDLSRSLSFKSEFDQGVVERASNIQSERRSLGTTRMEW